MITVLDSKKVPVLQTKPLPPFSKGGIFTATLRFLLTVMMRLITPENERSSSVTDTGKSIHRKSAEVKELLQNYHSLRSPRLCGEFS